MRIITYLASFFLLSSCANKITSGNYVVEENLAKIQQQNLTKAQIIELAGPPSIIEYDEKNKENDKKWIYVGRKYIKRAFFDPKIVNQEIVVIDFTNPTLENSKYIAEKLIDEQKEFGVERKVTKDYVPQKSYFSQFFGNLGKFNRKAKDKKIR